MWHRGLYHWRQVQDLCIVPDTVEEKRAYHKGTNREVEAEQFFAHQR